ncbi:Sodium/glutamate symporter [Fusobacterium sp. DD29]|uniref:sodium/glutamate symporter n=1 Tax=unclassified Fusobacterium TaxID=2648384 RepID=UPI001B8C7E02|nr:MULTISPECIES: sodium/glutamate symporter [unclassified Fusobacterium]MBR8701867.1 Sodium/glutamate symporter [Fusobacterium sp. DD45]MBR8711651.1 Sodium/glutamate symporter [Fusobacterium sp. DD28]MBR8749208.1 Sodium/glutamate symporter [Fusobacterium sp. DD29]MBR8752200.1 Sodium/glutamate symporter [Fusobacterium sp. DD26]MBR8761454.1 Sodium/glutamate symporter [Fusobacterium sp. DD25]
MNINLSTIQTMALAVMVFYLGKILNNKFRFLKDNCIPDAVTGGTVFSIITLIGHETGLFVFTFEDSLRDIFMIAFFTTVGFSASIKLLKKAGLPVLMFLISAVLLAFLQNVAGVAMAKVLNVNLMIGLATGSLATTGGPGTAGAFGPIIEGFGTPGATMVAMATATYALIAGSIIAGPICKRLIEKRKLIENRVSYAEFSGMDEKASTLTLANVIPTGFQIIIAMGIGSIISNILNSLGLVLPPYIGAMFAASIMRNLSDETGLFDIDLDVVSVIGSFTLAMFLSMVLMSFKLWELKELALPLIIMLIGQTVLMGGFAYFITFRLTGKDYDAAVMTGGHCGCGFGTTPKALANMEALTAKYLPSPKAFFVIPIVGGLFIDFFNAAIITFFINILK